MIHAQATEIIKLKQSVRVSDANRSLERQRGEVVVTKNLFHAFKLACFVYSELSFMDHEEVYLILMKLNTRV